MTTRAILDGERLVVATTGNRSSDFAVTFDPTADGRGLVITRTIDDVSLRQPVTVRNLYRRVSDDARWGIDASDRGAANANVDRAAGGVVVPDGTRFVAMLDNPLSTSTVREGELDTMTARSPSEYEGAVIEGFVSTVNESERLSGRAGMTLNIRSIRLRNGRASQLDGIIESIRTPAGETVEVHREGSVDRDDRRTLAVTDRNALGAAVGAIIGAVAGGGRDPALGAVIGEGVWGGTVVVVERGAPIDLQRGTEVRITSGDPRHRR
jgi:hypothetical protein